jgi:hypothetical protein
VAAAVGLIAESLGWVCAERRQPNLGWMADHLAQHGELSLTPRGRDQLTHVSVATVRRMLDRPFIRAIASKPKADLKRWPNPGSGAMSRAVMNRA